jgi:hypothetical protein
MFRLSAPKDSHSMPRHAEEMMDRRSDSLNLPRVPSWPGATVHHCRRIGRSSELMTNRMTARNAPLVRTSAAGAVPKPRDLRATDASQAGN